jgi:hypothetical protein
MFSDSKKSKESKENSLHPFHEKLKKASIRAIEEEDFFLQCRLQQIDPFCYLGGILLQLELSDALNEQRVLQEIQVINNSCGATANFLCEILAGEDLNYCSKSPTISSKGGKILSSENDFLSLKEQLIQQEGRPCIMRFEVSRSKADKEAKKIGVHAYVIFFTGRLNKEKHPLGHIYQSNIAYSIHAKDQFSIHDCLKSKSSDEQDIFIHLDKLQAMKQGDAKQRAELYQDLWLVREAVGKKQLHQFGDISFHYQYVLQPIHVEKALERLDEIAIHIAKEDVAQTRSVYNEDKPSELVKCIIQAPQKMKIQP